jgi:membrane-bound metal-dependent hydrolase YbcI (DUF457 family)
MGRGHATMGAAVWLAGCAAVQHAWADPDLAVYTVGTAVCAGWALASDLDHPSSTVSRSVGPVSHWFARALGWVGARVHDWTRSRWDRRDLDGHRTITHTVPWAVLCGGGAAAAGRWGGPWTAAVLVFFAASVGVQAGLPPRWRRVRKLPVPVPTAVAAVLAYVAYGFAPGSGWWLGLAVGVGVLVHCVGDMLTDNACPVLWPIPIGPAGRRRRWYPVGPPKWLRFNAGGKVETLLVQPLLTLVLIGAVLVLAWPVVGPVWEALVLRWETVRAARGT